MRLLTTFTTLAMTLAFLWAGTALAQSRSRGAIKLKRPVTVKSAPKVVKTGVKQTAPKKPARRLTFDDDLVEAGRAGGGGMLVKGRVKPNHSQLIPIRQDFVPELIKSADYI